MQCRVGGVQEWDVGGVSGWGCVMCFCFLAAFVYSGIPSLSAPSLPSSPPSSCDPHPPATSLQKVVFEERWWSMVRASFTQNWKYMGLFLMKWSFIRMVFHWGGLSSGWSFIRMVFHQGSLLPGQSHLGVPLFLSPFSFL